MENKKPKNVKKRDQNKKKRNKRFYIYALIDVSAKITDLNEVTPHSDVVWVYQDGWCAWQPRYELSATHCHIDVSWFPFDVQTCQLVFESWTLTEDEVVVEISYEFDEDILYYYMPSDDWILKCASS